MFLEVNDEIVFNANRLDVFPAEEELKSEAYNIPVLGKIKSKKLIDGGQQITKREILE